MDFDKSNWEGGRKKAMNEWMNDKAFGERKEMWKQKVQEIKIVKETE